MNYFDLYSSYPDRTIAAAWDAQVKEADKTPWLAGSLTECGDELFTRFAACYAELRALRRGARRTLQRRIARSSELAVILPEYLQRGGRRLQHRMAWSLAGAALLLALGQGVGAAATITVTTNNPNIASDGQCSLIEAINNANDDAATFPDCAAGNGADTIVLPANANLTLSTVDNTTFGPLIPNGLPTINSRITIEGNGATIARQGSAPAFNLIIVSGDLTLESLTLSGGSNGVFNLGTLSINNSTVSGNQRGVSNFGTLSIKNSTISGNTGGGISNFYATLTIENSTISGNVGDQGGGISNISGGVTITNSTISGNIANAGGGLLNTPLYGYCEFFNSCSPATLALNNSLIAGNQAAVAPEIENVGSVVNGNNFNLFGSNSDAGVTGFTPGPTDIVPSVSLANILGPLKNNGGPTQTHALLAGSPAIDAGNPGGCLDNLGAVLLKDQRGFPRNVDGNNDGTARCDIGAVEFGAGSGTTPIIDFDGDGKSDITVYRDGIWYVIRSSDGHATATGWGGAPQDIPVPGDYDGDGKVDHAVYRDGTWFILRSSDGDVRGISWGGLPQDKPVPGDYDGDGKADLAVYRDGTWFISRSSDGGQTTVDWGGVLADVPVPADYDGDGKADVAVYRDGTWFIIRSSDGAQVSAGWGGAAQDIPVPGDYDGDGKADLAVYRDGFWFILRSSDGVETAVGWGLPQDKPVPGDYDGDGKTDQAVYRDGTWFILRSSDGDVRGTAWGGLPQDIPLK
jgi:FG-GAP-like repeat